MKALFVVALAFTLRLSWVWLVPSRPVGDFAMYWDASGYLIEHRALDPEFVFMPGYVALLALVRMAGGGLLAAKVTGAALGSIGAGAVYGIADRLWEGRAGLIAGLLCALWPGGIAVASVTGTDMPCAVLIAVAVFALVRWPSWPIAFGVFMGLAAWVRAVALPLAALSFFFHLADQAGWFVALRRTILSCVVVVAVLSPWAVRNHERYGEWFVTDSHGGLTALVGANPNTDGRYSRSLNRTFEELTGYTLLAEPHRQADRASYRLAREWTAFEPAFAAGLLVVKLERLLDQERGLLYWPVYRDGVLPAPDRSWFDAHRREIEDVTDGFWAFLVCAFSLGIGISIARKDWPPLALIVFPLALAALYGIFFAEVRYHLSIALLLFPLAGAALSWLDAVTWASFKQRRLFLPTVVEAAFALACLVLVTLGWPRLLSAGERLRERHRWAVNVCRVDGRAVDCRWTSDRASAPAVSMRGVWNGVGFALPAPGRVAAVSTDLEVTAQVHSLSVAVDVLPPPDGPAEGTITMKAGDKIVASAPLAAVVGDSRAGHSRRLDGNIDHPGGVLRVSLEVTAAGADALEAHVWFGDLRVAVGTP